MDPEILSTCAHQVVTIGSRKLKTSHACHQINISIRYIAKNNKPQGISHQNFPQKMGASSSILQALLNAYRPSEHN